MSVTTLDHDEPAQPDRQAEEWNVKELALGDKAERRGHGRAEGGDVELTLVIRHIQGGSRRINAGRVSGRPPDASGA